MPWAVEQKILCVKIFYKIFKQVREESLISTYFQKRSQIFKFLKNFQSHVIEDHRAARYLPFRPLITIQKARNVTKVQDLVCQSQSRTADI